MNGYSSLAAASDDQGEIVITRVDGIQAGEIYLADYECGLQGA